MTRDALEALAKRVEQATGPDRELDAEISWVCFSHADTSEVGAGWREVPAYIASLDAAMSLADEYLIIALSDIAADGMTACCICSDTAASPPVHHWGIPVQNGPRQQVMAQAVTAAALRAKAALP